MVSKTLICSHEPQFTVDCEIIWTKLQVTGAKPYYIGAYYRPHESDEHSLLELRKSLEKVRAHSGTILLIGDLNLPKLDWKTDAPTILPSCQHKGQYEYFLEIVEDFNLTQLVKDPTRFDNILDLFLTTNETLVDKVSILPGLSDHNIVSVEMNLKPRLLKIKPHQVFLYRKANWQLFRDKMEVFKNNFLHIGCHR